MSDKIYADLLDIPVVGPGSQPRDESEEDFGILASPGEMPTFTPPMLPEPEEVTGLETGMAVLADLLRGVTRYKAGAPALIYDIGHLDAENLDLVNQVLNEGEVSVVCAGDGQVQIQESVLTGIWRVRTITPDKGVVSDVIEVADIPSIVPQRVFAEATALDTTLDDLPPGVRNAPSLIIELAEKIEAWQPGRSPHVINLTLLPLSQEDLTFLGARLGVGPITVLSRGYGNCRIGSTAKRNVWWVKYYNSEDVLILNTIEVVDVPEVAKAAAEDLADTVMRLREILQVYGLGSGHAQ
jgi:hydrogenase-1 operon protein HyaF